MSQSTQEMYPYGRRTTKKRKRSASSSGTVVARKARFSVRPTKQLGGASNQCIIPVSYDYDVSLAADISLAFAWCHNGYVVNGGSIVDINGLLAIRSCFLMMRVHHVEITVMPSANMLALNDQTLSSGTTNIPFFYDSIEFLDPHNERTKDAIQANPTCRTALLNKQLKRTIYPRVCGSSDLIDAGKSDKTLFMRSQNTGQNTLWNGYCAYADMVTSAWTYGSVRFNFKVYYECMYSK